MNAQQELYQVRQLGVCECTAGTRSSETHLGVCNCTTETRSGETVR